MRSRSRCSAPSSCCSSSWRSPCSFRRLFATRPIWRAKTASRSAASGHLAPAGALDAGLSAPRLPAPSLLIPSLGEIPQMLAPLAALKPPDWVSHPYVLGPAVVMNLVLWVGGLYLFDRPTFTRLFTLTPPVHVAPGTAVCFSLDDAQPTRRARGRSRRRSAAAVRDH